MARKQIRLTGLSPGGPAVRDDVVAVEEPLVLYVNEVPVVSLFCTPDDTKALAAGFLFAAGVLRDRDEVVSAGIEAKERAVYVRTKRSPPRNLDATIGSGCGGSLIFGPTGLISPVKTNLAIEAEMVYSLVREFQGRAVLFRETGGVHCAAICRSGEILFFAEDIGRHNAVDKVIGEALLAGLPLEDKMLLLSGRIAYDISVKAARGGVPICISRAAPTSAALDYGERIGLTIIGFVRGKRMNIYTHPERVIP